MGEVMGEERGQWREGDRGGWREGGGNREERQGEQERKGGRGKG